jgi:hypothetical protein
MEPTEPFIDETDLNAIRSVQLHSLAQTFLVNVYGRGAHPRPSSSYHPDVNHHLNPLSIAPQWLHNILFSVSKSNTLPGSCCFHYKRGAFQFIVVA